MAEVWAFLTSQNPATTFLFGLIALMIGALFNSHLNRRRDDWLRAQEAKAVAAALYGEILLLRREVATIARLIAKTYWAEQGSIKRTSLRFDATFLERNTLSDPVLYHALAAKLGLLPPDLVLAITEFQANYKALRDWMPKLVENEERGFSYSVLSALNPARDAVTKVVPALRKIEKQLGLMTSGEDPDIKEVVDVIDIEEENFAMYREMQDAPLAPVDGGNP